MTPNEAAQLHALIDQLTAASVPSAPPLTATDRIGHVVPVPATGPVIPPIATDRTGHVNPKPPSHPPVRK